MSILVYKREHLVTILIIPYSLQTLTVSFQDVPLFLGLLEDLFPGLTPTRVSYKSFKEAVEGELAKKDLIVIPEQVDKVIQLYETMMARHCVMVVGPTGGGKTVVIETLARAQTTLGYPTKLYVVNPKAQSVNELYGMTTFVPFHCPLLLC
jgi:dynein heavy chain, axonemal